MQIIIVKDGGLDEIEWPCSEKGFLQQKQSVVVVAKQQLFPSGGVVVGKDVTIRPIVGLSYRKPTFY